MHPARDISGPSCCGKSVFLTNSILNTINEVEKIYTYSPSLHRDFHEKITKCFSNYKPFHITPTLLNEKSIVIVVEEVGNDKGSYKTDTEKET